MSIDDLAGRKALIKASGLKKGHVLDIGMGECGCMSFFLAKRGFNVIGIDRSPYAIHNSRKDTRKKKFKGNFEAKLANAENLPFGDNEFDAVFAYHSMHHMDNIEKVIDEMFRVCKKGGFILISELNEKGRKVYEHEADKRGLLKIIEKSLTKYTKSIRMIKTKYNMIFICKKQKNSEIWKRKKFYFCAQRILPEVRWQRDS
jgi:ubiquinone/menaquinone biosynthesis C-methylase UbiE